MVSGVFVSTAGASMIGPFLLIYASQKLGLPLSTVASLITINAGTGLFASFIAGSLADKVGRKRLLVAGYAFYGLVYIGFALARAPTAAWLLFALYGVYSALTEGLEKALVADVAPAEHCATFIGLHSTVVGIGLLPASLLAGALWSLWGPTAPFWFGGALGLLSALGLALVL